MTIDSAIKQKVVELYLEGRGRNEIARILNGQKMRISGATITYLIKDWESQNDQQLQPSQMSFHHQQPPQQHDRQNNLPPVNLPLQESKSESIIQEQEQEAPLDSKYTDDDIIHKGLKPQSSAAVAPPLANGDWPTVSNPNPISETNNQSAPTTSSPLGGPLSHFLNKVVSSATATTPVATIVVPESIPHPSFKTLPEIAFDSSESTADATVTAPETESKQVSINNDANYVNINSSSNYVPQNGTAQEENKNEQYKQPAEHHQSGNSKTLSNASYSPGSPTDYRTKTQTTPEDSEPTTKGTPPTIVATAPVLGEDGIADSDASDEKEPVTSEMDWDSDQFRWSRMMAEIRGAKEERRKELLSIDQNWQAVNQKWQELTAEKQNLIQFKQNLDARESKLIEIEHLIPIARQLQQMGTDITNFLPYVEILYECAQQHNTNLTTAAFEIVKNLKAYRELKVLENSIGEAQRSIQQLHVERQQTEQQLAMLNMSTMRQQKALSALSDLQTAGFSSDQISDTMPTRIDVERIARYGYGIRFQSRKW
jgi:hypothetical protein